MIISRRKCEREMQRERERLIELDAMNSNIQALANQTTRILMDLTIRVRKLEVDLIMHIAREKQGTLNGDDERREE